MNTNTNTSALDLAARILAWLGPNGRENSASLLLYEAMQELKRLGTPAMAAPAAQTPAADLQGLHDALLAPREIVRDELGHFSHPALPYCDEGTDTRKLMAAFGLQCKFVEMDGDAPEDFVDAYFEGDNPDCSDWTPTPPAGDGWALVCIFDSEDGPYAMFVRPEPREQVSRERAALPAQAVAPAHCLDVAAIRNAALDEAARLVETTRETTTIVGGGDTQRHLTARKTAGDLSGMTWAEGIRGLKAVATVADEPVAAVTDSHIGKGITINAAVLDRLPAGTNLYALAAPVQDVAPSAQQASELAADILIQLANEAPINGNNLAQRRVLWSAAQLRSAATPAVAKDVAPTDDRFDAETWAELHRLREEIKGPPGYATWKDAAVAERLARVRAEGAASPAVAKDVAPSDAQTAPAAKPAGPAGSDALEPFRKLLAAWDGQGAALPPGAHLLMQMNHAATELRDALAHAERAS